MVRKADSRFIWDAATRISSPPPPAPELASDAYAVELIELYRASLLRDVAFSDYPANAVAKNAALELSAHPEYAGPRDASNKVTPELLFRGGLGARFAGETAGPYPSQFLVLPTRLGSLPVRRSKRCGIRSGGCTFAIVPSRAAGLFTCRAPAQAERSPGTLATWC